MYSNGTGIVNGLEKFLGGHDMTQLDTNAALDGQIRACLREPVPSLPRLVVIGDSHSGALYPGLYNALCDTMQVVQLTDFSGCKWNGESRMQQTNQHTQSPLRSLPFSSSLAHRLP